MEQRLSDQWLNRTDWMLMCSLCYVYFSRLSSEPLSSISTRVIGVWRRLRYENYAHASGQDVDAQYEGMNASSWEHGLGEAAEIMVNVVGSCGVFL